APTSHGSPSGLVPPSSQSPGTPSPSPTPIGHVLMTGLENPGAAFIGNNLYVWQQISPLGSPVHSELMRVNPLTGRVLAKVLLGSSGIGPSSNHLLTAGGWLWVVATESGAHGALLRFQPDTLQADGRTLLPGGGAGYGSAAAAGGWIWVTDGGYLYKVSPSTGAVITTIGLGAQVATNQSGDMLIVSGAQDGFGAIESRNPATGALVLSTKPGPIGVTAPKLSEVTGRGVWLSVATGTMGYIQRLDVATLRPTPLTLPFEEATNGISAQIMGGVLYVQQNVGGAIRNYCGNPTTGQMLAPLGLGSHAMVVTANSTDLFYIVPNLAYSGLNTSHGEQLVSLAINARCRV
ncbi:MAG: NHL repeat-containing protein, partial [Acidiferrobacteraceae bacterium]